MTATLTGLRQGLAALIAVGFGIGQAAPSLERRAVLLPRSTIRTVLNTPALAGVSLRARTAACDASARLSLTVDGRRVISSHVSSTEWRRYQARLSLPSGRHAITLSYPTNRNATRERRYRSPLPSPSGRYTRALSSHLGRSARHESCRQLIQVSDLALARAAPSLASPPAPPNDPPAGNSWSGDFSTGNLSQWTVLSTDALPGRITVGAAPGVADAYAGRFEIGANDPSPDPTDPGQQRTEVRATQAQSQGYSGSDVWYGWSVYFPDPGFTTPTENPNQAHAQTFFTQWKRTGGHCGDPNAFFEVSSPKHPGFYLGVQGGINETDQGSSENCPGTVYHSYRLGDFTPGRWYDFVFNVKWSSDPAIGFVQVWIDGSNVLPKTYCATLYRDWDASSDHGVYLRQGELRIASPGNSSVVYIAGTRVGISYTAVASDFGASDPRGQ
jgi:hypothetical protein